MVSLRQKVYLSRSVILNESELRSVVIWIAEMSEQMMAQNMATFRNGMADFLNRTAGLFSNSREKRTFLINNTHHVC